MIAKKKSFLFNSSNYTKFNIVSLILCQAAIIITCLACSDEKTQKNPNSSIYIVGGGSKPTINQKVLIDDKKTDIDLQIDSSQSYLTVPEYFVQFYKFKWQPLNKLFSIIYNIIPKQTICAGALINENTIISARHCFFPVHSYSYFIKTPQKYADKHYIPKLNNKTVLMSIQGNNADKFAMPPESLKFIPHQQSDLTIIKANNCVFYKKDDLAINLPKFAISSKPRFYDLTLFGSGGTYFYSKGKNSVRSSSKLSAIQLHLLPELINNPHLPPAWPNKKLICSKINEINCLANTYQCSDFYQITNTSISDQCDFREYKYWIYMLKIRNRLETLQQSPWHDITDSALQGLKHNIFLYDPLSFYKANDDKSFVCYGDSGGPVLNNQGHLIGLISAGLSIKDNLDIQNPKYKCNSTLFVVELSYFANWINYHLATNNHIKDQTSLSQQFLSKNAHSVTSDKKDLPLCY